MEPAPTTLGSLKENLMAGQACACVAKTGRKRRCNMLHYTIKDVLAQGGKTRLYSCFRKARWEGAIQSERVQTDNVFEFINRLGNE